MEDSMFVYSRPSLQWTKYCNDDDDDDDDNDYDDGDDSDEDDDYHDDYHHHPIVWKVSVSGWLVG